MIDYKKIFELFEKGLIEEGSKNKSRDTIKSNLNKYTKFKNRRLDDDSYFKILVCVVFYSGMKAQTVTDKIEKGIIEKHFSSWSWKKVSEYTDKDVEKIMSDSEMIRNKKKIVACVNNAKKFREIIKKYGSFRKYIDSFKAEESLVNLLFLKEDLEFKFSYIGKVNVYHFLTDIGMNVLKPDRVIMRIFKRLGLIDHESQFLRAVFHGREFKEATGHPIRYIDIIFAAYGQVKSDDFGIKEGICLNKPRCRYCYAEPMCEFDKKNM